MVSTLSSKCPFDLPLCQVPSPAAKAVLATNLTLEYEFYHYARQRLHAQVEKIRAALAGGTAAR